MRNRVRAWFAAVPGRDALERRQAQLLQVALVALALAFGLAALSGILRVLQNRAAPSPVANLIALLITIGLIAALRRGWFLAVTVVTVALLTGAFVLSIAGGTPTSAGPFFALLMVPIVLAGLLLDRRWLLLTVAGVLGGALWAVRGQAPAVAAAPPLADEMGNFLYATILITAIVLAFGGSLRATLDRVVAHERELEVARGELEQAVEHLRRETGERTRLETELAQHSRLESIGRLAGGVAHDFNNLLTAIRGYATLLEDDLADDPANARRDLAGIEKAADQATSLTRQLLAFSRRQELRMDVVDVGAILTGIEPLLRRLIGERVLLVVRPAADLWPVLADRGQLESVIVNLAVNARDAMSGSGGTLTIESANVVLDETYAGEHAEVTPGPYVMIAVTDTGIGMDRETVSHIFEPFFTTKELGSGTGLGLATVYGTVRQSGGHIWVYSEPGQGTSFKIYLPRTEAEAAPHQVRASERRLRRGHETVLLAEDEDLVRDFIVAALERAGHEVIPVGSGEAALEVLANPDTKVGILISDVVMPGIDGPELLERVWGVRPKLPAILMSGYTAGALEGRPMPLGAVLLEKPFTADELEATIAAVMLESAASPKDEHAG